MRKDTFVFYPSFLEQIEAIKSDKIQLALYMAVANYGVRDEMPDFSEIDSTGMLDSIFVSIKRDIDAAKERRGKVRQNGKKGGAPKGNANARKSDSGECDNRIVAPQNNQKTTKNNQKTTQNNLDVDVDVDVVKKKFTNVNSQKEETSSSMSFDGANDALHPSEHEESSKVAMVKKECDIDFNKLAEYFNSKVPVGGMPQVRSITPKRKAAILAREKEHGKNAIIQVIDNATESPFLNGDNDTGFVASFDWIFRPNNFPKVFEGNYGRRTIRGQSNNGALGRINDAMALAESILNQ